MKTSYSWLLSLVVFILLNSTTTSAQGDFVKGKIFLENGAEHEGLIEKKLWNTNPTSINFIHQTESSSRQYDLNDLKRVESADFVFEKFAIKYEVSSQNLKQITDSPIMEFLSDTALLRVIMEGPISLMSYKTPSGKPQFYIKENGVVTLLEHRFYTARVNENDLVRENNRYRNQLIGVMKDCPSITQQLSDLTYKQDAIEKIVKQYFECINYKPKFILEREKSNWNWGLTTGFALTKLIGKGTYYGTDVPASVDYTTSLGPAAGGYVQLIIKGTKQKLRFHTDVLVTQYKVEGAINKYIGVLPDGTEALFLSEREIEQIQINIYPGLVYKIGSEKLSLDLKAGLGIGAALFTKSSLVLDGEFYERDPILKTSPIEVGFYVGGGLYFNRFTINVIAQPITSGLDPNGNARLNKLTLALSYRIKNVK